MAEKKKDDSALVAEEMADGEDPHESDEQKKEKEEKQKKNDEFNRVPDDIKNEAAAEQLGAELVQLGGQAVGIKGSLSKNIKRLNLAQIRNKDGASSDGSEEGETISDLTNKAKDEISNSTAQTDSKKDDASSQEKKEEKKEEPKKEEEKKESEGDDEDGEKKKERPKTATGRLSRITAKVDSRKDAGENFNVLTEEQKAAIKLKREKKKEKRKEMEREKLRKKVLNASSKGVIYRHVQGAKGRTIEPEAISGTNQEGKVYYRFENGQKDKNPAKINMYSLSASGSMY